jgi:type I restriction-modification system DNA methylase subunit
LREFGDFQTPAELADMVVRAVYRHGGPWRRALEPTCGTGSFLRAVLSLKDPPREIRGIELQSHHLAAAKALVGTSDPLRVTLQQADIFTTNLAELPWTEDGPLLVLGNPPWVTNAALGSVGSSNLPKKSNLKRLPGFAAMTGESNFDIAEYIWIKLIRELAAARPTIALLSKTQVARNLLKLGKRDSLICASCF